MMEVSHYKRTLCGWCTMKKKYYTGERIWINFCQEPSWTLNMLVKFSQHIKCEVWKHESFVFSTIKLRTRTWMGILIMFVQICKEMQKKQNELTKYCPFTIVLKLENGCEKVKITLRMRSQKMRNPKRASLGRQMLQWFKLQTKPFWYAIYIQLVWWNLQMQNDNYFKKGNETAWLNVFKFI